MTVFPTPKIECAFGDLPTSSSRTWVDITAYTRGFSTRRGRNTELDRIEAGEASVLLSNLDQRFDPNNSAGPYYGDLVPMTPIRITCAADGDTYGDEYFDTYGDVRYPIFSGLVQAWPQEYPDNADAVAPLRCVDLFRSLNLNKITASYSSEATGTRVANVLTSAGWPTGADFRDIDTGQSTIQAATLTATPGLAHLQDVATSESGLFFVDRDGRATFIDRHSLLLAPLDLALTWSDTDGYSYLDIGFLDADVLLWNDISVVANALTTQTATDSTSVGRYFTRDLGVSTLLSATADMLSLAQYLLTRYKDPGTRVARLVVTGMSDQTAWPAILDREIGDKVRVERTPPGSGDSIVQDSVIEAIEFRAVASPRSWVVTWSLSPMDAAADYWILDDPIQSLLDTSTRLAF